MNSDSHASRGNISRVFQLLSSTLFYCLLLSSVGNHKSNVRAISVEDFGIIENTDQWDVAMHNSDAFLQAVTAATDPSSVDRTVVFPVDKVYYLAYSILEGFSDLEIKLEGTVRFSDDFKKYPLDENGDHLVALWYFSNCESIRLTGTGTLDGQGLKWWRYTYLGTDIRPKLISFEESRDILVSDVYLLDSPKFFLNFHDCADVVVHDITIFTDSSIVRAFNRSSVTYALNTDGIDLSVYNATIYNNNITNYDDAIVAKPCRGNYKYCQCSGNILAYNNHITYSVGLTIGSVPPNDDVNCVRNVTFRDSSMYRPLKGIYIKSNPGDTGTGIIEDITYDNIHIREAVWWTIWIGPQQQNQPGGDSGTGCNFMFPFIPVCPTQPLVSINRITLHNIIAEDSLPLFQGPGVILCDPANPCTDIVFDNVTNSYTDASLEEVLDQLPIPVPGVLFPTDYRSDDWEWEYLTANVYGSVVDPVEPAVCMSEDCFWVDPNSKLA